MAVCVTHDKTLNRARYNSKFQPSMRALNVLKNGKILAPDESPQMMMERVVQTLFDVETHFGTSRRNTQKLVTEFGERVDNGQIVINTAILTNAGRYQDKPLSGCAMIPFDAKQDLDELKGILTKFHAEGMGTGFNLENANDPAEFLRRINDIAIKITKSGIEDRPVGNIVVCPVDHPRIVEFITSKYNTARNGEEWKVNISVAVSEEFFLAVSSNKMWKLKNGHEVNAKELFDLICRCACYSAEPGILFLDRIQKDNPAPMLGEYQSVAPCGEVGLAAWEICHFSYLNLAAFVKIETKKFDYEELKKAVAILTRSLDNAAEVSIRSAIYDKSKFLTKAKRKIGVGICGFADACAKLGISYDSEAAREFLADTLSLINFISKQVSYELAHQRGSCLVMLHPQCAYNTPNGFIERKYAPFPTKTVNTRDWLELANRIRKEKALRNIATTSLPPTGRSSLILDASSGIEPFFNLATDGGLNLELVQLLHTLPEEEIKRVFKTALEITPQNHVKIMATAQRFIDESISKTINLPAESDMGAISELYMMAYQLGLKGLTVYRDGSHAAQPKKL